MLKKGVGLARYEGWPFKKKACVSVSLADGALCMQETPYLLVILLIHPIIHSTIL